MRFAGVSVSEGTTRWREKIRLRPNVRRNTGTLRTATWVVGEWVAGTTLDARTAAGIVGGTLSSAASAVCLGGDRWI
jgi:hypothetical protein